MLHLVRGGRHVEIAAVQWAGMIAFLTTHGWETSVPLFVVADPEVVINDKQAQHFAAAGRIVLGEALKDPFNAYALINFDMGKFAEVVAFAAEGGFTIRKVR